MKPTSFYRAAVFTALSLLIPLVGTLISDDWQWTLFDFIIAALFFMTLGISVSLIHAHVAEKSHRTVLLTLLFGGAVLTWVHLAVGIV